MKKFLTILILSLSSISNSQTPIYYDYIETFNWFGDWWVYNTSGFYTNISVSPDASAVHWGQGSSSYEGDWYVLPNVALDPTKSHMFKFRVAAQKLTNPTAGSGGMDTGDYITVQVSTDGGVTYIQELRITGYSNATWDYNTNGVILETLDGINQIYTPSAGGDRTNTGDGWSDISLVIPQGNTDLAVDLYVRANSNGEDWWIDNIELFEISGLPVELTTFEGIKVDNLNVIRWETSTEHNSSHFLIKRSTTMEFDETTVINIAEASGNSQEKIQYNFVDKSFPNQINYYQLTQVDIDGHSKTYGPITIDNRVRKNLVKITNLLGQDIDENYRGVVIEIYDDGSTIKTLR